MFNLLAFILWVGLKIESKLQGQCLIHVWEPVEHTEDAVAHFGTLPKDQLSQMLASHSLKLTFLRQSAVLFAEADFKKHNLEESSYIKVAVTIKDGSILPEYFGCTALFLDWFFCCCWIMEVFIFINDKKCKKPQNIKWVMLKWGCGIQYSQSVLILKTSSGAQIMLENSQNWDNS